MNMFWGVIVLMTVVSVGILAWPLFRRSTLGAQRAQYDIQIYKDQLQEVERDLEQGLLNAEQAEAARTEIKRRMLAAGQEDSQEEQAQMPTSMQRWLNWTLLLVIVVCVPLGAVTFYRLEGVPGMADYPLAERKVQATQQTAAGVERRNQMSDMIAKLEAKLTQTEGDVPGWDLLGQSYASMGQYDEALKAYETAVRLSNRSAGALIAYGETLVMAADGTVDDGALAAFAEAQQKDSNDPRPYFYRGLASAQKEDLAGAMEEWQALVRISPPDAAWLPEIRERILAVAEEMGVTPPPEAIAPTQQATPVVPAAPSVAPGPSQQQMEEAAAMNEGDRQEMIRGMVERLAQKLEENPNDIDGWQRLVRAYQVLGDTAKAAEAQARVDALSQ